MPGGFPPGNMLYSSSYLRASTWPGDCQNLIMLPEVHGIYS